MNLQNQTIDLFQYEEELIKEKQKLKAESDTLIASNVKDLAEQIKKVKIQIQDLEQNLEESESSNALGKIDKSSVHITIDHKDQNNIVLQTVNILRKLLK